MHCPEKRLSLNCFLVLAKISSQTRFTLDTNDNGIHLTSSDVDFQFKKMGILALYFTASNYSALSVTS